MRTRVLASLVALLRRSGVRLDPERRCRRPRGRSSRRAPGRRPDRPTAAPTSPSVHSSSSPRRRGVLDRCVDLEAPECGTGDGCAYRRGARHVVASTGRARAGSGCTIGCGQRSGVEHLEQLLDVDVLGGQPAAHDVVAGAHHLDADTVQVGVQVAGPEVDGVARCEHDALQEERRRPRSGRSGTWRRGSVTRRHSVSWRLLAGLEDDGQVELATVQRGDRRRETLSVETCREVIGPDPVAASRRAPTGRGSRRARRSV